MSRSRAFTASLELPPSRNSSVSPVGPSRRAEQQTAKAGKTKTTPANCEPRISLPEQNAQSHSSSDSSPADSPSLRGEKSVSSESLELREELERLREREVHLSHLLSLEKEQRVRAEQLVEVERLACLQLQCKLGKKEWCGPGEDVSEEVDAAEAGEVSVKKFLRVG